MCEFSPREGNWPCAAYLNYRSEVFALVTLDAERLYPELADSVVMQALLVPMGFSHRSPIGPAFEAQRLVRKAWAVVRGWNPRPIIPAVEFPVAPAKVYDNEADSAYKVFERDIPDMVLDRALDTVEMDFWHHSDEEIGEIVETLGPLLTTVIVDRQRLPMDVPTHQAQYVERVAGDSRARVLSDLGTIASTKQKRGMTKGRKPQTMGAASEVLHRVGTSPEHFLVGEDGKRQYLSPFERTLVEANPYSVKPRRVGTEREEESDDRISDLKRPAVKGNTRKNKRSGRLGGSAIVR